MSIWRGDVFQAQSLAEAIFMYAHIDCEATFYWVPHLDQWHFYFKTRFKYLSINEKFDFDNKFCRDFEELATIFKEMRETIAREYNYYFNAIWC
jgi:hypothetical protein